MRAGNDPSALLLRLAAAQNGVLSSEQCHAHGLGRHSISRLLAEDRWQRIGRGIYWTRPDPPSWLGLAWAGILLGGDRARLGGRSAGHVHGLLPDTSLPIHVYVPEGDPARPRDGWIFTRERPGLRPRVRGEPPRTGLEDTVLDLCAGADEREVIELVTRAVQTRRTSADRILLRGRERGRMPHRRLLTAVLAEVGSGAESPLEIAYLRDVERAHRLPAGARQVRSVRHLRDVLYEEFATVVELDRRAGHEGLGRFRDMDRDNAALLLGAATLRFGWHDVRGDPCRVARQVALVLGQRGWAGQLSRCRRCRG